MFRDITQLTYALSSPHLVRLRAPFMGESLVLIGDLELSAPIDGAFPSQTRALSPP